ncbi:MAG: ABC transporter permease [Erysipelotrichaceae bacterium]|nr:ABC transporter permease [Erysipelotrichaceae bacterium]MDY5251960.1 ABC transporter permease [Erysipelotrichaceae bacterium]
MKEVIEIQIWQFLCIYLLLLLILAIMRKCKVDKSKMLLMASFKMTIQLALAGFILTYIFDNPHLIFTIAYLVAMISFTIYRVLKQQPQLNNRFKLIIAGSIAFSGLFTIFYFIFIVVGNNAFTPQYVIPISGMLMGNTMTGVSLGLKTFVEALKDQKYRIEALSCAGVAADKILLPFVKQGLETAILPTLNSMLGMGIVSLPGMMTGQMLAGTLPTTAILYQIAIIISICATVCLSCFIALYFGSKTLYGHKRQIINLNEQA